MTMKKKFNFTTIILLLLVSSCKKETLDHKTPIVFVHGFLAAGDTYEKQAKRFTSNGYSLDDLYTFDYNSLDVLNNPENALDNFINEILSKTKAKKVNLVGHSRGAILVYDYCKQYEHATKIEHLAMLAGIKQSIPAGPSGVLPTLNIFSKDDKIMTFGGEIKNATNLQLQGKDHYEVATSAETFEALYRFFNQGKIPATLDIQPDENIVLSGKAASFGENIPKAATVIEVYEINALTGFRINQEPTATFKTDIYGNWGSFNAKKSTYYEFVVYNPDVAGDRKVHYYREPFLRSDKFIYLRTYPAEGSLAGIFLSSLPKDDKQSVAAFFGASQAVIAGRDILTINGYNYSNNTFANATNTTIALFLYDENNNKKTDNSSIAAFALFPFLKGADAFYSTELTSTILFEFNGRNLPVCNWKSASEGVSVAVFE